MADSNAMSDDDDGTHAINSTADEVLQSTEIKTDESDDNLGASSKAPAAASDDNMVDADAAELGDDDAGGLFGSGSEDEDEESASNKRRKLDDEAIDSGDDEGRADRVENNMEGYESEEAPQQSTVIDISLGRHGTPRGSDGELYLLKLPNFLGIEPKSFDFEHFQPPATDHHSDSAPSSTFSAYQTATSTLRWRHSPGDLSQSQSNARILRWSDGSLTVQLSPNPTEQYELPAKPLAPPQYSPLKPTPTAVNRGGKQSMSNGTKAKFDARLDSHTYLTAPHESASFIRITNHLTSSLTVQSSTDTNDEALIRLQESLAAAVRGDKNNPEGGLGLISIQEDPELAKKKAEIAEREKLRAQRRRQNQEERERDRANRVLGRSGLSTGRTGLTVGGLEDDDGMTTAPKRSSKPVKRQPRRRNSEYSEDEEDYRNRGRTKEDEYDEDDGFLVGSDEEPELVADDDEEEEEDDIDDVVDDADGGREKSKKKSSRPSGNASPKRAAPEAEDGAGGTGVRTKRRRVVDEDEEDDM